MSDFKEKKTRQLGMLELHPWPVTVPTDEYVVWLEEQLAASKRIIVNLRKSLDQYSEAESRRARYDHDHVPYADDDRYE